MSASDIPAGGVYRYPHYYAIGYQWNTTVECDFLERCLSTHGVQPPARVLDIGCGAGRHLLELARRGHRVAGFDVRPEMIDFVRHAADEATLSVEAFVADLCDMPALRGPFDLAICLMDTFRFLLTNEQVLAHLRAVGVCVRPGGLYVTDFWIPTQWDQIANDMYQWEQTQGQTTVRVLYLQHPETVDPIRQTFEDELVFTVEENGRSQEIRGERTRTRLILPQEFQALVEASGVFRVVGTYGEFDAAQPLGAASASWRMISVLQRRAAG